MGNHSTHGANQRQRRRLLGARAHGAYYASVTALNGYARFVDVGSADAFAASLVDDEQVSVHVYDICQDVVAVDWSDAPRHSNGNTVR